MNDAPFLAGHSREIGHMYFGKWCDIFEHYKKMHNMAIKKMIFAEPQKEVSILDL